MSAKRDLAALGVLLAFSLGPGAVSLDAFLIQTFEGPLGAVQQTWRQPQAIPYLLHSAGSDDLEPALAHRLLRESFQVWDSVSTSRVGFIDRGLSETRVPSRRDRQNLLFFDETGFYLQAPRDAGIIAVTRLTSDDRSGEILDADIIFNGRDFRFSGDEETPHGRIDLKDVAIHEIGHLLGLDHTPLDGPPELRPTMNPFNRGDGPGEGRTLEADDIAGISALYPAAGYQASTASISGRVTSPAKTPLFGTHLIAENLASGELFSTLSGSEPDAPTAGDYLLQGLTPGRYRLQLSAVEGAITEENFGGIFTDLATGFPLEYFDNTTRPELATVFTLTAGQHLDGIDFVSGLLRPGFPHVSAFSQPANTPDDQGPYAFRVEFTDASQVRLRYRIGETGETDRLSMSPLTSELFTAELPGQPVGTRIFYQFEASSPEGNTIIYPHQDVWLDFAIVRPSGSPIAFTALRGEDAVGVIDTGDQRELARINVGEEPIQILLAPESDRLFVSNLSSNEVVIIDSGTFQILDRIAILFQPLDMALSPDRENLYVTNSGSGSYTRIDIASGTATTTSLPFIGSGPYGIAAAGDYIYATDIGNDQVMVLDADGNLVGRLDAPASPRSLAASPDGHSVYLTSLGSGQLTVIDVNSNRIERSIPLPVGGTFAVAPSPDGRKIYLTAHEEGLLLIVDSDSGEVSSSLEIGRNPRGISFSPAGDRAYITNSFSNEITIVDTRTEQIVGTYTTGQNPRGIALAQPVLRPPATAVDLPSALPALFTLSPTFPNPFNATAQIAYSLPGTAGEQIPVRLKIYDILGRPVRSLVDRLQAPGPHRLEWDGSDENGLQLASGTYLLVLRAAGSQAVQKMLLLR